MKSENSTDAENDPALVARALKALNELKFTPATTRADRWRTTEQLAESLGFTRWEEVDHLNRVLEAHEAGALTRLREGEPAGALIRRAKYPDRTTALPLWGSVELHGQPWLGNDALRTDPPDDLPRTLVVPDPNAPTVFLSYTRHDSLAALGIAEALARLQIKTWRFETHIEQHNMISACVKSAINEADLVLAVVTRWSIASLWVLTELHTAVTGGGRVALVVNTADDLLVRLLESAHFAPSDSDFDLDVKFDHPTLEALEAEYRKVESKSRSDRFCQQVRDFLASLPFYLSRRDQARGPRIWQPAFAFPQVRGNWKEHLQLCDLSAIQSRLASR